jgi:hypothetical protein
MKGGVFMSDSRVSLAEFPVASERKEEGHCEGECGESLFNLFVKSQPFLVGFLRLGGYLPLFREVLPSSGFYINDDFVKLRSAERELSRADAQASQTYLLSLDEQLANSDEALEPVSRREITWNLLRRFVFRFDFQQTMIMPLPETGNRRLFTRMLIDKLPKDFGSEKVFGFFNYASQKYISFSNESKCHFIVLLQDSLDANKGSGSLRGGRSVPSLWCAFGGLGADVRGVLQERGTTRVNTELQNPLPDVRIFAFSEDEARAEWLSHNSVGILPQTELNLGPEAWMSKKSLRGSAAAGGANPFLGSASRESSRVGDSKNLEESRRIREESFWIGIVGKTYRLKVASSEREVSMLEEWENREAASEFRMKVRDLGNSDRLALKEDLRFLLEAR